jgi:hypothetical protein
MKTMMVEQLSEYSKFPLITGVAQGEINAFDMELEKDKTEMEHVLGKVVKTKMSGGGSHILNAEQAWGPSEDWGSSEALFEPVEVAREESSENGSTSSNESTAQASTSNTLASSAQWGNHGEVITSVTLPFEPFRIAVCPQSGDVALLWKDSNKVYLYDVSGNHLSTIHIKYGNLWDIGFSLDNCLVVVNRANNRLLFYTKDKQFVIREKEVPRTCLKYTYLSIAEDGRLIVTSARTNDDDDDDDDEVVQCVIVYEHDESSSKRMFGRKHLQHPVSRAVVHHGTYYIVDEEPGSYEINIKTFNSQGQAIASIYVGCGIPYRFSSLAKDINSDRLIMGGSPFRNFIHILNPSNVIRSSELHAPNDHHIQEMEILSKSFYLTPPEGMLQVEIYVGEKMFNIVHYRY